MAITTTSTPFIIAPVYEPVSWVFTSNQAGIFQLRADIFVDGNFLATWNAPADLGTSNQFTFDIAEILQDSVNYDHSQSISGNSIAVASNAVKDFYMEVFEVYLVGSVITTNWLPDQAASGDITTSTFRAHHTAFNPFEDLTNYDMKSGQKADFLTLRKNNTKAWRTVPFQLDFITEFNQVKGFIEEYNAAGVLVATQDTGAHTTVPDDRGSFEIDATTFNAATTSIQLYLENTSNAEISNRLTLNVETLCGSPIQLDWGNHLGGMDSFVFELKQGDTAQSSHVTMRSGDTGFISAVTGNRDEIYEAFAGVENEDTLKMLVEMMQNNKAATWKVDGVYYPIMLLPNRSTKKFRDTASYINQFKASFKLGEKTDVIRG